MVLHVALVLWLPHAFLDSLLITLLYAHAVFERPRDREWHNPSETSSDGRGGSLEQIAWVPATQRHEKLSINK